MKKGDSIFFYDSKCGSCNSFVSFLKTKSQFGKISFICLHTAWAKSIILKATGNEPDLTTSYLLHEEFVYDKSDAIFRSLSLCDSTSTKILSFALFYLNSFIIAHVFFDFCYDFFSRRRKTCKIST